MPECPNCSECPSERTALEPSATTPGSPSSDADFIAQAKKWCEEIATLSDGEIVCKLADILAERYAAIAALKANVEYDERRFERIRFLCFGDVSERYAGWNPDSLKQEMEWAEERTGESFRKLRDRVLGLQENAKSPGAGATE
jgi:broad specificity phosphatase PhoE